MGDGSFRDVDCSSCDAVHANMPVMPCGDGDWFFVCPKSRSHVHVAFDAGGEQIQALDGGALEAARRVRNQLKEQVEALEGRKDPVNNPGHYHRANHEVIEVIEAWGLGVSLGNTLKYIARHALKGSPLEDLKKARWYLDRAITEMELKK